MAQELPPAASDALIERLTTAIGAAPEVLPEGVRFMVRFDQDVSGLSVGAPVTVKGLRVGTVREVAVVIDSASAVIDVPVVIDVVPERITVDGGMPAHNHGLPTQPRVTQNLGEGCYKVEGLRFHMQGHWEMKIGIESGGATDTVIIPLDL